MPTAREYEAALERNPADTEAFVALRKAYRQAKEHDKLITLYETRAQAIEDGNKAAELFYLAAELRLDQLSDTAGAEADLANAVHRNTGHIRAAARLKDLYREQGRTSQYMEMLELEAGAVARTRDPARSHAGPACQSACAAHRPEAEDFRRSLGRHPLRGPPPRARQCNRPSPSSAGPMPANPRW